jgi:cell wall-associated NlpC family hydrolase
MKTLTTGLVILSLALHARSEPLGKNSKGGPPQTSEAKAGSSATSPAKPSSSSLELSQERVTEGPSAKNEKREAAVTSIEPEALVGFEHYAPQLQQLIREALALTKLNLTYTFGASNPKQGGMDCSGTIWYLLTNAGLKSVPRQSNEMAGWVQSNTLLHRTPTATSLKDPEFAALQPGDLLFWTGTYETSPRKIPVTHVMLYLGKLKKSGRAVVFGASDGRVYQGERRTGVSVFDFSLPSAGSPSAFYGYGLIPGVGRISVKPVTPPPAEPIVAKTSAPPVTEISDAVSKPVTNEDIRPAVVPKTKPASTAMTDTQPSPAVRYSTRDEPPTTTSSASKPKTTSAAAATSSKAKAVAPKPSSTSKTKAKTGTTTKPATPKKKAVVPPPTPQEQLSKAARKIGSSFKELFSN